MVKIKKSILPRGLIPLWWGTGVIYVVVFLIAIAFLPNARELVAFPSGLFVLLGFLLLLGLRIAFYILAKEYDRVNEWNETVVPKIQRLLRIRFFFVFCTGATGALLVECLAIIRAAITDSMVFSLCVLIFAVFALTQSLVALWITTKQDELRRAASKSSILT